MDQQLQRLKEQIQDLPNSPGVYIMKDAAGRVLYVGKSKDLRKRVFSYASGNRDVKTAMLVRKIRTVEYIATANEYEALLLENNLIKKWKPHYNINLKDGKSYPMIRITNEEYPRVFKTRTMVPDGSHYFGPFTDVGSVDLYLELIEKLYPLRKCRGKLKKRYAPCLYYHIGRCSAPCAGKISKEEYQKIADSLKHLLQGNARDLLGTLKKQMQEASLQRRYEEAAKLRDAAAAVEASLVHQSVEDFTRLTRDYIGCVMRDQVVSIAVFQMREGKMLEQELHRGESFSDEQEALESFLPQYYLEEEDIPETIYVSHPVDAELLERLLKERTGRKAQIRCPQRGKHLRIMAMVLQNASMDADRRQRAREHTAVLEQLKQALDLPKLPVRIEGFDIAHLSGSYPAASLVSFRNGVPDKAQYRTYHIKSLGGKVDDYEALREVTARRYTRLINEHKPLPDLVLIDGGTGQVNAVKEILDALGLDDLPVAGLAKEFEEIHFPGSRRPLRLPEGSEALKLLQAVRDETHRVATGFSTSLRAKDVSFTVLESIEGIGRKRSECIMRTFGSLEKTAAAGADELSKRCSIPLKTAERVIRRLKESGDS